MSDIEIENLADEETYKLFLKGIISRDEIITTCRVMPTEETDIEE